MFEKIKQKAKDMKSWMSRHKMEVGAVIGYCIGVGVMGVLTVYDDKKSVEEYKKKYPQEIGVIARRKYANGAYAYHGTSDMTINKISDSLISEGVSGDEKVVGALIYTNKEK